MKFLYLIWKNAWRRKIRTIFTLLSVFVAFVLFAGLMAVRTAFEFGVDIAGADRLVVIHKVSLVMPLPIAYQSDLAAVEGVEIATHNTWFGGVYQDPANFFAQIVVEPEPFMEIYTEYELPDDQMAAWLADRQGAVVGRDLANRFGWEIGDRIPIQATIWQARDGSPTWEFNIVGIYDGADGVDKTQFFFKYEYLEENRVEGASGIVGWYIVKIDDATRAQELASQFDAMFANSSFETKTTTEKGFLEGFANQMGDIGAIMVAILSAVLFTILLVTGNTMAQSVRERTSELAVLKTLGFSGPSVLGLVLGESLFLAVSGGGLGLYLGWLIVKQGDPTGGMLPTWVLTTTDVVVGVGLILLLGTLAGLMPAVGAMRLKITDALRKA